MSNGPAEVIRLLFTLLGWLAVPAFFFLSGYFFFSKLSSWSWPVWKEKMKKRLKSLLVPYLLWCIIALFTIFIWQYLHDVDVNYSFLDYWRDNGGVGAFWGGTYQSFSTNIIGQNMIEGFPIDNALWYVRDLLVLCAISPLLYVIISKLQIVGLSFLAALYVLNIGVPFPGCCTKGVFFFCCGGYLMINKYLVSDMFQKVKILGYVISMVSLTALFVTYGQRLEIMRFISALYTIFGVISLYNVCSWCVTKNKVYPKPIIVKSCFFVYAIHQIVILDLANFILWRIMPIDVEAIRVLKVLLRPILALGISFGLYCLMRRFMPRTLSLLTGYRK